MNRNQRRNSRSIKRNAANGNDKETDLKCDDIEEVFPPKNRRSPFKSDKPMTNRCCYITPDYKDVEQSTEYSGVDDQFHNLVLQQYDFDPTIPDAIKQIKELRKVLCGMPPKVENCSQYINPKSSNALYVETVDGSQWQSIDNAEDIDEYLSARKADADNNHNKGVSGENICISKVPNVKVIVEKFSKFKKNNVELRKLDEKIVCIEYDVFEKSEGVGNSKPPIQKMRAYFSIKQTNDKNNGFPATIIPSSVKRNFNITDEDLGRLNEKEIEIIDDKIVENQPYLDDLKKLLQKKQITAKKDNSCLDLKALYELAKRETSILSATDPISKAGLEEVKNLITNKCETSKHGINRKTLKNRNATETKRDTRNNVVSECIFDELINN